MYVACADDLMVLIALSLEEADDGISNEYNLTVTHYKSIMLVRSCLAIFDVLLYIFSYSL